MCRNCGRLNHFENMYKVKMVNTISKCDLVNTDTPFSLVNNGSVNKDDKQHVQLNNDQMMTSATTTSFA